LTIVQKAVQRTVDHSNTLFCTSIQQVSSDWDRIVGDKNVYLTRNYLQALEEGLEHTRFHYIQFFSKDRDLIGVAYCQIIPITPNEINVKALSERVGGVLPENLINSIDMKLLICGNAFATGENGFLFSPSVHWDTACDSVNKALGEIHLREKKEGNKIAITLIKEFWSATIKGSNKFKESGFSEVNIDVNMVLRLDESWKSFEDYLAAMNSKFRTKATQVLRKSTRLDCIDFDGDPDDQSIHQVDELYNTIVDKANFSFGRLNGSTLFAMKKSLGDNFFFRGYYLDQKLIGFSTATLLNDALDGNFIGLNYGYNQDFAVYQRMLYDFVKYGIDKGVQYVRIGRTAEEIKSGVGAQPVEMKFYAKHRNKLSNALLRPFIQHLKPSKFNQRRPFKLEYYDTNKWIH
jgi:predicted N-acyltransferase